MKMKLVSSHHTWSALAVQCTFFQVFDLSFPQLLFSSPMLRWPRRDANCHDFITGFNDGYAIHAGETTRDTDFGLGCISMRLLPRSFSEAIDEFVELKSERLSSMVATELYKNKTRLYRQLVIAQDGSSYKTDPTIILRASPNYHVSHHHS
jgi:hypothetical protein